MVSVKGRGEIKVFGIFGHPVMHSLSPQMHQAAFEALGLPHLYLPFDVRPAQLKKAVEGVRALGIHGVNVTIPHKETVLPFLDQIDQDAEKIGAVNTIEARSGRLIGHNTDGSGFLRSLMEKGCDPKSMTALLIGAGGAAKGVAVALLSAGVSKLEIRVRNLKKGRNLAAKLRGLFPQSDVSVFGMVNEKPAHMPADRPVLLINATPLGMRTDDPLPFPAQAIKSDWLVADLIYRPLETPLLLAAKKRGAQTLPGMGMLLHQGALSLKIWTHLEVPIEVMRKSLFIALFEEKHPV